MASTSVSLSPSNHSAINGLYVILIINNCYFCPVILMLYLLLPLGIFVLVTITVLLFIILYKRKKATAYKSNDDFNNYLFLIPHKDHSEDKDSDINSKIDNASNDTGKMLFPVRTQLILFVLSLLDANVKFIRFSVFISIFCLCRLSAFLMMW